MIYFKALFFDSNIRNYELLCDSICTNLDKYVHFTLQKVIVLI